MLACAALCARRQPALLHARAAALCAGAPAPLRPCCVLGLREPPTTTPTTNMPLPLLPAGLAITWLSSPSREWLIYCLFRRGLRFHTCLCVGGGGAAGASGGALARMSACALQMSVAAPPPPPPSLASSQRSFPPPCMPCMPDSLLLAVPPPPPPRFQVQARGPRPSRHWLHQLLSLHPPEVIGLEARTAAVAAAGRLASVRAAGPRGGGPPVCMAHGSRSGSTRRFGWLRPRAASCFMHLPALGSTDSEL
jgi:hypothetical protein